MQQRSPRENRSNYCWSLPSVTIMGHMGQGYIVEMLLYNHYINYSNRIVSFSRVSLRMLGNGYT